MLISVPSGPSASITAAVDQVPRRLAPGAATTRISAQPRELDEIGEIAIGRLRLFARAVIGDLHAERGAALGDRLADAAEPDDADPALAQRAAESAARR